LQLAGLNTAKHGDADSGNMKVAAAHDAVKRVALIAVIAL